MSNKPLSYGVILYPGFQLTDVAGPIDVLNVLSSSIPGLSLSLIAETLSPVSTLPPKWPSKDMPPMTTSQQLVPTHTFATAPDLDVLIVPGGMGSFDPADFSKPNVDGLAPVLDFIKKTYPQLKYLLTVCTGSGITSVTGILDGKRATMFKKAWPVISKWREQVKWVSRARWTEDGNVWTSSGVSSGTDLMFAFAARMYGQDVATEVAEWMEYVIFKGEPEEDPFGIDV
jgi:transcriptional regulator GlxA family with amidase domain